MDAEKKQEFTRRISQSNRSELVVIQYEILDAYLEDARLEYERNDYEAFTEAVKKADRVLAELSGALNFKYGLAGELYALYNFARRALMSSIIRKNCDGIADAERTLAPLWEAFRQIAAQDTSEPLMRNAQQVYAGITYGKENLKESFQEPDTSRGFFA